MENMQQDKQHRIWGQYDLHLNHNSTAIQYGILDMLLI